MKKKYWHCEYYNCSQSGGLRSKTDGQQEFYVKMSSLAYENEADRIKGLKKMGFEYDKELSNDGIDCC